jgi:ATP-binding cassette subfamily B multidrug efflux pump
VNLALAPNLSTLVRWQTYRYVLRQSLGFFQNDYAGRISQKVMQTGMAVRESVVNVVDGVWYLAVYIVGTVAMLGGFDWRLDLPLLAWTLAYAIVILVLVPPVRERAAAMSEANSGLTGRVVDGFTNVLSVKLFAHAEREEAFGREAFERQLGAAQAMNRAIVTMTAWLTIINSVFIFAVAALSIWLWTHGQITLGGIAARTRWRCGSTRCRLDPALHHVAVRERRHDRERDRDDLAAQHGRRPPDAVPLQVQAGAIAFQNVRFRYGEGEPGHR